MASPADFPANFSFIIGLKQHLICGNGDEVKGRETKQNNLFKARLDQVIDMRHPRVLLAQ